MRKMIGIMAILMMAQIAFASQPRDLSVKIDLSVKHHHLKTAVKNVIGMNPANHCWLMIAGCSASYIFLARIEQSDSKQAKLGFLIVESKHPFRILAHPEIIVAYNQPAKMVSKTQESELKLNVLVRK